MPLESYLPLEPSFSLHLTPHLMFFLQQMPNFYLHLFPPLVQKTLFKSDENDFLNRLGRLSNYFDFKSMKSDLIFFFIKSGHLT